MAFVDDGFAEAHLGAFEAVDLFVHAAELVLVERAVEAAVGELGHLGEHHVVRRVDGLHRDRPAEGVAVELAGARVEARQDGRFVLAQADAVEADAEGGGELGGGHGQDRLAHVVVAVRQQDDDLRAAPLDVLHPVDGHGEAFADRGAGLLDAADVHAVDAFLDPDLVDRERAQQVGLAREDHGADAVVGPLRQEVVDHVLAGLPARHLGPRRAHVQGHHRPGEVHDEHDVHAFGLAFDLLVRGARSGDGDHEQDRRQPAEEQAQAAGARERLPQRHALRAHLVGELHQDERVVDHDAREGDEADQRANHQQGGEEGGGEAHGDDETGIQREGAAVLVEVVHRRPQHGGHRQKERKLRRRALVHAQHQRADDG